MRAHPLDDLGVLDQARGETVGKGEPVRSEERRLDVITFNMGDRGGPDEGFRFRAGFAAYEGDVQMVVRPAVRQEERRVRNDLDRLLSEEVAGDQGTGRTVGDHDRIAVLHQLRRSFRNRFLDFGMGVVSHPHLGSGRHHRFPVASDDQAFCVQTP